MKMLKILILVLTLSACSSNNLPKETNRPTVDIKTVYPVVPGQVITQYPVPMSKSMVKPESIVAPKEAPLPENGKASISGIIFSKYSSTVLSNFRIYLSRAQGPNNDVVPPVLLGPLNDKGDIIGVSDENGIFEFNNLEPGNYYLIVIMPMTYEVAINSINDDRPKLISLKVNQRNPLGVIIFP